MGRWSLAGITLALCCLGGTARAQTVPDLLDFQGYLRTESGQAVTKTVAMTVSLYDAAGGGSLLYSEELAAVPVYGGRFSILVGATKPIPAGLFETHAQVFLGLSVDGSLELPRQQLRTVPYAFRSRSPAAADEATVAKDLDCAGCVTTSRLSDQSVTAAKLGEACEEGQFLARVGGKWQCATLPSVSGKDFALSSQVCEAGRKVQGIGTDGTLVCGDDEWQAYTAGTGLVLEEAKFSLDLAFADGRYVNAGEAGSVTGAMLADGGVTASKLGEPCQTGEVLKKGPGGWRCEADAVGVYTAGPGLELAGDRFSLRSGCGDGEILKWDTVAKDWRCAADQNTPVTAGTGLKQAGNTLSVDAA